MYFSVQFMAHRSSLFLIWNVEMWIIILIFSHQSLNYLLSTKVPYTLVEANLWHRVVDLWKFSELANLLWTYIIIDGWLKELHSKHRHLEIFYWGKWWCLVSFQKWLEFTCNSFNMLKFTFKTEELCICAVITGQLK